MFLPVTNSFELQRVKATPRRVWTPEGAAALAREITPHLVTDAGRAAGVTLFPLQALGLKEAYEQRGLFAAMAVGAGKTLLSWLIPLVCGLRRPLLLIPAALEEKTYADYSAFGRLWQSPRPPIQIEKYSQISQANSWDILDRYNPDGIICDEAHKLRNTDNALCARVDRYMDLHPETLFFALTGTILRKSIKDFAHLLKWALKDRAPVPATWKDLEEWSLALDEKVDAIKRVRPGALMQFANEEDRSHGGTELEVARRGFQRRLSETPGVIVTDEQTCDQPIYVTLVKAPEDPALDEAFKRFRQEKVTPDDWALSDPLSELRHGTELSCGFYYKWDPRPPAPWMARRTIWSKFVRDKVGTRARNGRPLDTEFQIAKEYSDSEEYIEWKKIEPTFKPNSVAVWLTGSVLGFVAERAKALDPCLIWVKHNAVGEALSRLTGLTFYAAGGRDFAGSGMTIDRAPRHRSAIVGVLSNREGRNLQGWHKNVFLSLPQPAPEYEQAIGRTHRPHQTKPVYVEFVISSWENVYALSSAIREAQFVRTTQGHTQKILIAQFQNMPELPVTHRWDRDA